MTEPNRAVAHFDDTAALRFREQVDVFTKQTVCHREWDWGWHDRELFHKPAAICTKPLDRGKYSVNDRGRERTLWRNSQRLSEIERVPAGQCVQVVRIPL
ncbi:hypothetical protein ACQPXM_11360 [Kribbella sp. CA-253562]|uniref:hypothetical protein n=1 Tax=Kribbella sp. CA-253562 TaxID=3239942 RepID=UPI003D915459